MSEVPFVDFRFVRSAIFIVELLHEFCVTVMIHATIVVTLIVTIRFLKSGEIYFTKEGEVGCVHRARFLMRIFMARRRLLWTTISRKR